jgi:uncharacterized protein with von Willebrand factor type A (vWA) domain
MKQQAFETTSITESLVAFAQFARSHGLNIGLSDTQEALRAAGAGLLTNRSHLKSALKTLWCHSPEERMRFEKLFLLYWDTNPTDLKGRQSSTSVVGTVSRKSQASLVMLGKGKAEEETEEAKPVSGANETERLKTTDLAKLGVMDAEALEALSKRLFHEMAIRMRRRMKAATHRGPVNLRRTIRKSLHYGGEPLELFHQSNQPRKQRLIVLLDISGSMDQYSHYLLRFICALREYFRQLEAFIFSTSLTRITRALQSRRLELVLNTISQQAQHWSGGTKIGTCLTEFQDRYGKQLLNGSPTVLILSDGLDTGDPAALGAVLAQIKKRAKRVIWLNPLKGMQGYAPVARGMQAALPSIDEFRPAHNLQSLLDLEKILQDA